MNTIFKRDKMYMSDEESFVVSEFDIMDESLNYTLDFNTKGGYSIFSNMYDTKHPKDSWTITIDQNNAFYEAIFEFISKHPTVVYHDEKLPGRFVTITVNDDLSVSLKFNVPYNEFNVVNIKISEQDPYYEHFAELIDSLSNVFTKQRTK